MNTPEKPPAPDEQETGAIEHPFAPFVRTIGRGKRARRDFTREEAEASMAAIINGQATQAQIGAWLMLLRVKEETAEELAGFVDACREDIHQRHGALPAVDIDWPSYAGKKKHSPWYVLAALCLGRSGKRILMHGGPAHTPARIYTDQVLEALGVPQATDISAVAEQLDNVGFSYIGLDLLSPRVAELLTLRFELGLRSPINTLARCINPARAPLSLQSVFHPAYIRLQRGAAALLGEQELLIFKGEGGEIEIRPDAETRLFGLTNSREWEDVLPATLPRQTAPGAPSIEAIRALWQGHGNDAYGLEAVLHTMAVILFQLGAQTRESALATAQSLWESRDRNLI